MDDSDDYFGDDDLIIDAETAAALEESERRHATQALPSVVAPPVQPASKRLRTNNGWTPGFGSRTDSMNDFDMPEITLQGNGYAISNPNGGGHSSYRVEQPQVAVCRPEPGFQPQIHQLNRQKSIAAQASRLSSAAPAQAPPRNVQYSSRRPFQGVHALSRTPSVRSPVSRPVASPSNPLEEEIQQLREKLEELRQSNDKFRAELNDALEVKMAKDGEVTILRKNIEKNHQNHVAELAKLKAAKEEVDTRILRTQKENREELERLRTQFKFKQQELEGNLAKAQPSSVRTKKIMREPPATPQSASRGSWNTLSQRPLFNVDSIQQTPSRPSQSWHNNISKMPSPKKQPIFKSPEKSRKPPKLPGFQNAFAATSTPLSMAHQRSKDKGKTPELIEPFPRFSQPQPTIPPMSQPFPSQPFAAFHPPDTREPIPEIFSPERPRKAPVANENIFLTPTPDQDGDVAMDSEEDAVYEEYETLEPVNWKAELSRVMLTHVRPTSGQLTLQLLLAASVEEEAESGAPALYMKAYSSLINALSYSTKMEDYEPTLEIICAACITLVQVLSSHKLIIPLASLFNLLAVLLFYIPKFRTYLYRQAQNDDPNTCDILGTLSTVLTTHLPPTSTEPDKEALGMELLEFLEALCFDSADHEILRFSNLIRDKDAVVSLLSPSYSLPFLQKSARVIVLLSTHSILYRALLSLPDPQQEGEEVQEKNAIVEHLCTFMVESSREGHEWQEFRQHLLAFFTQMSLAHPDAHAALTASPIVLASLIFHLHQMTSPIFDDERLDISDEVALSLIKYVGQCACLVHHLVFKDPGVNLRHRLQQAPSRPFNSVLQMFVVTFSHLSWADPPDWLSEDARNILDRLADVAEALFVSVVEGPEGDEVWAMYDEDPDETQEEDLMDEEQMEAELS